MAHNRTRCSIWDLDPFDQGPSWPYEDFEIVFLTAFSHAFGRTASRGRINGYLQRYFRFGVVPHWVRAYVREELHGVSVGNLATAPLDPQIDVGHLFTRLRERLAGLPPDPPRGNAGSDGWLRA